jgi:hypothetical protein
MPPVLELVLEGSLTTLMSASGNQDFNFVLVIIKLHGQSNDCANINAVYQ